MTTPPAAVLPHPTSPTRLCAWLARETTGGGLLLAAAALALLWANSPWRASYSAISTTVLGPASLGLSLPLSTWASDGLLAVFFFVVGIELKQEFVVGALRDLRAAAVPVTSNGQLSQWTGRPPRGRGPRPCGSRWHGGARRDLLPDRATWCPSACSRGSGSRYPC